jgi:hypothetical protein
MIAYNNDWLNNLQVQQQLEEAAAKNCISKEEKAAAIAAYSTGFYTPNIFIRTGLFILTVVIALFSIGLMALTLLEVGGENTFGGLLLFFGTVSYAALELMVRQKHHYKSGTDDALLWITGICIAGGFNLITGISATGNMVILFVISTCFFLRFANAIMGILVPITFLSIVFLSMGNAGNLSKTATPFILMLLAAVIYFVSKYLLKQQPCSNYKSPLTFMKITALIMIYAAGNYYTVSEALLQLFHQQSAAIPFGWLFWFLTFFIPIVYIFRGIQKRDIVLLRVGLLLLAAIVFTVKYYYALAPIEIEMALGGSMLIVIAYVLVQYLQQPKYGFTSAAPADQQMTDKLNIEALIIAETYSGIQEGNNATNFGGGSFGGGGASGDF